MKNFDFPYLITVQMIHNNDSMGYRILTLPGFGPGSVLYVFRGYSP